MGGKSFSWWIEKAALNGPSQVGIFQILVHEIALELSYFRSLLLRISEDHQLLKFLVPFPKSSEISNWRFRTLKMRDTISNHREAFIIRRSEPSKDLKCIRPKGWSGGYLSRHLALWYLGLSFS